MKKWAFPIVLPHNAFCDFLLIPFGVGYFGEKRKMAIKQDLQNIAISITVDILGEVKKTV